MNVGIITASDKGYLGEREDRSGARIAEIMEAQGYTVRKNLPGSPKAVDEALSYILPSLKHGLDILLGNDAECARK